MNISKCVCEDISFKELKHYAELYNLKTVEELQKLTGCGSKCGMCQIYIAEMLRTGKISFDYIIEPEE